LTDPEYGVPSVVQKLHSWTSRSRYSLPVNRPSGFLRLVPLVWISAGLGSLGADTVSDLAYGACFLVLRV
jgi:hypothetical protein